MFDWFQRKNVPVLTFPDNATAFEHACTLHYSILINARIPALVVEEGRRRQGERWYRMYLAGPLGALEIWGCTMDDAPAYPDVGDMVAFRIVRIATELPEPASLIGYIACRLKPVLDSRKGWRNSTNFTPSNLKPELHL